jgi:hypothetical protein
MIHPHNTRKHSEAQEYSARISRLTTATAAAATTTATTTAITAAAEAASPAASATTIEGHCEWVFGSKG